MAAGAGDLLGRLLGALGVEVDDCHLLAFPGQHEGIRLAEAAGGAGDQGNLAGDPEVHEGLSAP